MRICPQCREKTAEKFCPDDGFRTVDVDAFEEQSRDPLVGTIFEERYRIEEIIGKGGFGAVYRATQIAVDRPVAIKVLDPRLCKDLKEMARFQQEARAIAGLRHPSIIELYDFGHTAEGSLFLVMEYLEGEPLGEHLAREAPLSPAQVVDLGIQAFDALAEAHERDVIHRDIKPENLFVARRGRRREILKILDFGIAKVAGEASAGMTLTKTGMAIGSPRFMSPEQCMAREVLPQSDLYSLGLILYQALCGRHPFRKNSPTEYLMAHVQEVPPPPAVDAVPLEGPLVDLIMRCLAKQAEDRPSSAEEALAALEACRDAPLAERVDATGAVAALDVTAEVSTGGPSDTDPGVPAFAPEAPGPGATPPPRQSPSGTMRLDTGDSSEAIAPPAPEDAGSDDDPPLQTGRADVSGDFRLVPPAGPPRWTVALAIATVVLGAAFAGWYVLGPSDTPGDPPTAAAEAPSVDEEPTRPAAAEEPEPEPSETPSSLAAGVPDEGAGDLAEAGAPPLPAPEGEVQLGGDGAEAPAEDAEPAEEAPAPELEEPRILAVTVESRPSGAVVRQGGERLGRTPLEITWSDEEDPPEVTLIRYGHRPETVTLSADDAGEEHVVALARRPPPPKEKKPAPKEEAKPAPQKEAQPAEPEPPAPAPEEPDEPAAPVLDFEMVD